MDDRDDAGVYRVLDLYSGRGGVGLALSEMGIEHVGVDVVDYSDTYPGEFVQADASEWSDGGYDLVWASPPCTAYSSLSATHYGSREAAIDANPTIPELNVHDVVEEVADEYVIENVPGATREGHLEDPARINGLAFGLPFNLERHFETSFPVPDAYETGEPSVTVQTRDGENQSIAALAEAKGVPASWGKQGVRSAIPREYVRWILAHAPNLDVQPPARDQRTLTEVEA